MPQRVLKRAAAMHHHNVMISWRFFSTGERLTH